MAVFAFVVDNTPVAAVNIDDDAKQRILKAYATLPGYNEVQVDPEFQPSGNTDKPEMRPRTEAEMWQAIAGGWLQGTLANVQRIEEDIRRREITVKPIEFTPVEQPAPQRRRA